MHKLLFCFAAAVLTGCGGGGGSVNPPLGGGNGGGGGVLPNPATAPALKTVIAARTGVATFPLGAAIEPASTTG